MCVASREATFYILLCVNKSCEKKDNQQYVSLSLNTVWPLPESGVLKLHIDKTQQVQDQTGDMTAKGRICTLLFPYVDSIFFFFV